MVKFILYEGRTYEPIGYCKEYDYYLIKDNVNGWIKPSDYPPTDGIHRLESYTEELSDDNKYDWAESGEWELILDCPLSRAIYGRNSEV